MTVVPKKCIRGYRKMSCRLGATRGPESGGTQGGSLCPSDRPILSQPPLPTLGVVTKGRTLGGGRTRPRSRATVTGPEV